MTTINNTDEEALIIVIGKIVDCAKEQGYFVTPNLGRIAKAKLRFFGIDSWHRCPCYPPTDTEHGCGTVACSKQIEEDGVCHCNLFKKTVE